MEPLTMRIRHIKQPYGGYISRKDFPPEAFDDGKRLNEKENIHGVNVGLIVDYMTRFMLTDDKDDAFLYHAGARRMLPNLVIHLS